MKQQLWEILVPTKRRVDGRPIRTRFHRVWDAKVRATSGGLTVMPPTTNGQWVYQGELVKERMIPVRIMCTRAQIDEIVDMAMAYYDQLAIMAYRISDEVIMKQNPNPQPPQPTKSPVWKLDMTNLLRAIEELTKNPGKDSRKEYNRQYKEAVKRNGCGGYCSNPYACCGGCYEY